MDKQKIIQAGKIASQVREYIWPQIKKGVSLLELAEKIESKIIELGAKPAFPVNLSINEIAAHFTPSHDDKTLASGLLKIDFGVHVDGWISDTAFSVDLENSDENKKLIQSAEQALDSAIKLAKPTAGLNEIGEAIQNKIESFGFAPIINLSGHSIEKYDLHSGLTVPNYNNHKNILLEKGIVAIEPFASTGSGKVHDGKPSGIYMLTNSKNVRSPLARQVLEFIVEEYQTMPFCSRWLVKKFTTRAQIALKQLEENGNLHHFPQLVEAPNSKVAQAEHTLLIDDEVLITTL